MIDNLGAGVVRSTHRRSLWNKMMDDVIMCIVSSVSFQYSVSEERHSRKELKTGAA